MTQIAAVAKLEAGSDDSHRSRTGNRAIHNPGQPHTERLHSNAGDAAWNYGSDELSDNFWQGLAVCGMAGPDRVRPETCYSFDLQ